MQRNKEHCYNGNSKVKKAGIEHQYTQFEIDELFKCRDDIVYFLSNYVKIFHADKGMINFHPYEYQKRIIKVMDENRYSIFLLPRQAGKSTIVAAFLLHQALFIDRSCVAVLANKLGQSKEILARIKLMYEELPWFMQPGVVTWNKGDIELSNGSSIFSAATTGSSIRGRSPTLVYCDEFAFVENDVEFYTSTYPSISAGESTKFIITSTPRGMNLFYKLCTDAKEGRSGFAYLEVNWWEHPLRDEKWKQEQLRNMTPEKFEQEFGNKFLGSSDTLISSSKLQQLTFKPPINDDKFFQIYEKPKQGNSYVITVDTSEGAGHDYSTVNVIDVTTKPFVQVAKYRSNVIPPLMFAEVVYKIGKMYNDATAVIESNSIGSVVVNSLWYDFEYDGVLSTRVEKSENKEATGGKADLGVKTTKKTKLLGCNQLKALVEANQLIINDFDTISELTTFTRKKNSYEADKGKSDDLVMGLVMFAWLTTQPYFDDMTDTNIRQILRNNLSEIDEYSAVTGFFDDGTDDITF